MGKRVVEENKRFCPSCGTKIVYKHKRSLWLAKSRNSKCVNCAKDKQKVAKEIYKGIPVSWFSRKIKSAKERGIEFDITIQYVYSIYIKQKKECSLTGIPLVFSYKYDECNVSIDRIDSSKGYVKRNIQLVHKDVNYMKYIYTQKRFIELCKMVSEKHKDK